MTANFMKFRKHLGHKIEIEEESWFEGLVTSVSVKCVWCEETLFKFINTGEDGGGHPIWVKGKFSIGIFSGSLAGYRHPEFSNPQEYRTAFEWDTLLSWIKEEWPNRDVLFNPETDILQVPLLACDDPFEDPDNKEIESYQRFVGFLTLTEDGFKHLYIPSSWKFASIDDPDERCTCGHTLESHPNGTYGGCRFCTCTFFSSFYEEYN